MTPDAAARMGVAVAPERVAPPSRAPMRTRGAVIAYRATIRVPAGLPDVHFTGRDLEALRAILADEIDRACEMPPATARRGR